MALDLRKVSHFVAVAEELNFTRAADRLHMSQQALSASIRQLERELGATLLIRDSRQVVATDAGKALLEDGRYLLAVSDAALQRARRVGRGARTNSLRIVRTPAVTGEEVTDLLTGMRRNLPDLQVEVRQEFPRHLVRQLFESNADLGLCRAIAPTRGLASRTIAQHRLRLAMPTGHRLAALPEVTIDELADEQLVVWGQPGQSPYTDLLLAICARAGVAPRLERNPVQGTPPVTAVEGTDSVAFVTAPSGPAGAGAVVVRDLVPAVFAPLLAVWVDHTTSEIRDEFLASAES